MIGRRILLAANLRAGGNAADWVGDLTAMGYEVRPFPMLPYRMSGSRLARSLAARINLGPMLHRLNQDLRAAAAAAPFDVAIVCKGTWVFPETVQAIATKAASGHVAHLTLDSMFQDNRSRHFFASVPHYSLVMTDKRFEESYYRAAGARDIVFFTQGYSGRFGAPDPSRAIARTDICFVGHYQHHYGARLRCLSTLNAELGVWGPGWPEVRSDDWTRKVVRGGGLWGAAYPDTMAAARIGLGLLSKRIPEVATTRSVEIPASGAMLLAERTPLHQELFEENVEAEFFDGDEEMLDKARFYLLNETARSRVAQAGQARCRRSGYAMANRLRVLMTAMSERLGIAAPN